MLILQDVSYVHTNKDVLFSNVHLSLHKHCKAALIGANGSGKSTLLRIMAGLLPPATGFVQATSRPYYIPQLSSSLPDCTLAQALGIDGKLTALKKITEGDASETNFALVADDWEIEDRCLEALARWQLAGFDLSQQMHTLSGGQKTKLFLAGIHIHQPEIILMDEPSNHLDRQSRQHLYDFIQDTPAALAVVSHDRTLLNLLNPVYELSKRGLSVYGGNYDFYAGQKNMETHALHQDIKSKEKALRKAKELERENMERQQKLDARGKKKQEKAGLPTISMKTFKDNAEKSTARIKDVHQEKINTLAQELSERRKERAGIDTIKFHMNDSALHTGKTLITARDIQVIYNGQPLWKQPLSVRVHSSDRMAIHGGNGTGKTTLMNVLTGAHQPSSGSVERAANMTTVYLDQEYSMVNNTHTIYGQAQSFNTSGLEEHEVKIRLNRFLFGKEDWDKPCTALSGGEKMRLMLCCLNLQTQAPDIIILDEPTNNLDIQNIELLTAAIKNYHGTLLVISHDSVFLKQIEVQQHIVLD